MNSVCGWAAGAGLCACWEAVVRGAGEDAGAWVRTAGAVGTTRARDNALAESFVASFKTELITDRVWSSR
jgi:hypothetical protein